MLCCIPPSIFKLQLLPPVKAAQPGDRLREEGGGEDGEGEEAELDQEDLAQVQWHTEAKVDRGGY